MSNGQQIHVRFNDGESFVAEARTVEPPVTIQTIQEGIERYRRAFEEFELRFEMAKRAGEMVLKTPGTDAAETEQILEWRQNKGEQLEIHGRLLAIEEDTAAIRIARLKWWAQDTAQRLERIERARPESEKVALDG